MVKQGWLPYQKRLVGAWYLVYSKIADQLPITSAKLESQPCIDSSLQSTALNQKFYPLELRTSCIVDPYLNVTTDPRYSAIANFQVTQFDLETMNGVTDKLKAMPLYSFYISSDSIKQQYVSKLWIRRTIPWKLACEATTETMRENVFGTLSESVSWSPAVMLTVHITATVLLALTALCLTASTCTGYRALTYKNNRRYFLV